MKTFDLLVHRYFKLKQRGSKKYRKERLAKWNQVKHLAKKINLKFD